MDFPAFFLYFPVTYTPSKKVCTFWRFNPGVKPVTTNAVASGFTPRLLEKRFRGKPFENRYYLGSFTLRIL